MTALRARRTAPAAIEIGLTAIESQIRTARRLTDDVGADCALAIRTRGARFARATWSASAPAAIGICFIAVLLRIITPSRIWFGSGCTVGQAGRARYLGACAGLRASAILVTGVRARIAAARTGIRARTTARAQVLERVKGARARYCEGAPE